MTITTAKRPLRLAPLAAALLVTLPGPALAQGLVRNLEQNLEQNLSQYVSPDVTQALAETSLRVTPTLSVTETWTDNVDLQAGPRAHSELVTQLSPGISVVRKGRRLNLAASAQWHQFAYLNDVRRDLNDNQRQYNAALQGILVDDLLFIDASASRGQRSVSAFGPQLVNDLYALGNRTEIKTWSISPYLMQRFGHAASLQLRYTRDSVESGRFGLDSSDGQSVSAVLASGQSFQDLGWGLSYYGQDLDSTRLGESSTQTLAGNLSYRLTPRLSLTANAGYDRYDFGAFGGENNGRNWSAGFAWNPSQRTTLQMSVGRHYYGKTGSLSASHRSRYSVWSINYSDAITTTRQQFLLPAAIDTAALLDRLFSANYPDPVERERIVQAYIAATGLPPSLADNVNYLSNRYMRQKLLQASTIWRKGRSSVLASLYASKRDAVSDQQSDSELLGSQLATLNENVRQRGVNLTYNYQLNSRTNAVGTWNVARVDSLTTGIEDLQRVLRLGVTRRYGERLLGTVEVRRRSGNVGAVSTDRYKENAISASLSMQL